MKVMWRGSLNKEKGFGNLNYNVIRELSRNGYEIYLDNSLNQPPSELPYFCRVATNTDPDDKSVLVTSHNQNKIRLNYRGYQVLYTAIEGTIPDSTFLYAKNNVDEVWVPSHHSRNAARTVFEQDKIFVINHGIDFEIFNSDKYDLMKREKFTFFSVFRWTWRKAPDLLIDVFKETFKTNEADLVILTKVSEFPKMPKLPENIKIKQHGVNTDELVRLYCKSHAFVLPTRGEGWGLPLTEAGALGLPIITTNWGGPLEFLNAKNSFLLNIDGFVSPPPETGKDRNNLFANPSRDELKKLLRFVYENYDESLKKSALLKQNIKRLTWENTANAISRRFKDICRQ